MARSGTIASDQFKQNSIAGVLITQDLNGIPAEHSIEAYGMKDEKNSRIYGKNMYAHYENGEKTKAVNPSYDKIVIGYTSEALPFQIVVKGALGSANNTIQDFINRHLIPLVNDYAANLSQSQNLNRSLKNLIKDIYYLRDQYTSHLTPCEFTLSLAITFEQENELYCAAIGIGDTHLVVRKTYNKLQNIHNEVVPLACKTSVNSFHDAFDLHSFKNIGMQRVTNRNSFCIEPVSAGDEIVGFTYLLEDLLYETEQFNEQYQKCKSNGRMVSITDQIIKYTLDGTKLKNDQSLFHAIKETNQELFEYYNNLAKDKNISVEFGANCVIGSVSIPSLALQDNLKRLLYFNELVRFQDLVTQVPSTYSYFRLEADHIYSIFPKLIVEYPVLTRYLLTINRVLIDPNPLNVYNLISLALEAKNKNLHWRRLSELMLSLHPLYAIFSQINSPDESVLNLTALLQNWKYNLTLEDIPILAVFIRKHPKITHLNLAENNINDEMAAVLANALDKTNIDTLILKGNQLYDKGALAFKDSKFIKLDLSKNALTNISAIAFAQHPTLKELYLNHNQIDNKAMPAFRRTKLTRLSLKDNKIGDEGAKMLAQAPLTSLLLTKNNIGDAGAEALKDSPVESLDLRHNHIGDKGAKELAQCKNLSWLFLQNNYISPEGEQAVRENKKISYFRAKPSKLAPALSAKQLQSIQLRKNILKGILLGVGVSIFIAAVIALIVFSGPLSTLIPILSHLTSFAPIITQAFVGASSAVGHAITGAIASIGTVATGVQVTTAAIASESAILATGAVIIGTVGTIINTAIGGICGFIRNKLNQKRAPVSTEKAPDNKKMVRDREIKFIEHSKPNEQKLLQTKKLSPTNTKINTNLFKLHLNVETIKEINYVCDFMGTYLFYFSNFNNDTKFYEWLTKHASAHQKMHGEQVISQFQQIILVGKNETLKKFLSEHIEFCHSLKKFIDEDSTKNDIELWSPENMDTLRKNYA